jgi:hypothetical protein
MCECERLCCVRARVNIYLVVDWLETRKKGGKSAENRRKFFFRSEGYGEIFEKYFVGYTARSYSQLKLNFKTNFIKINFCKK